MKWKAKQNLSVIGHYYHAFICLLLLNIKLITNPFVEKKQVLKHLNYLNFVGKIVSMSWKYIFIH